MITDHTAWLIPEAARLTNRSMLGMMVLELGSQTCFGRIYDPIVLTLESESPAKVAVGITGKAVCTWLGCGHVSIDINGEHGSIVADLSKPITDPRVLDLAPFDLVTNYGTTEHVCTSGDFRDQWQAFKTVHDLCRPGGAMVHVLPNEHGAHAGCGYVYPREFFGRLAERCGYSLMHLFDSQSDANHTAALMLHRGGVFPVMDMKEVGAVRT